MLEMIADLPYDDRPRERLLLHGAGSLSDAELVALLLGSGTRGKNAIRLARELLNGRSFGEIAATDPRALAKINGIGPAKATRIVATYELTRRMGREKPRDASAVCDPDLLGTELVHRFAHERQEHLGAAMLDSRSRLIVEKQIYIGTINHAVVSQRDIVRLTLDLNAVHVILYHNHPSGDPTPSAEDIKFTNEAHQALKTISVTLVDHLVIGAHRYLSMKQKGCYG